MKISRIVRNILNERSSKTADQAHKLKLKYVGRGYWANEDGELVAQTVDGVLVKYDPSTDSADQKPESQDAMTELGNTLVSNHPAQAIRLMNDTGLLPHVLPEISKLVGVTQNKYHDADVFDHTMDVVSRTPPDLKTRLAALFHDCGKPATKTTLPDGRVQFLGHEEVGADIAQAALQRLKLPNDIINSVVVGVRQHMRLKDSGLNGEKISDKALRKLKIDLGDDLNMVLDVMHADNLSHAPEHAMPNQIPGIRARLATLGDAAPAKVKLPVSGDDVMQLLGIKPGPKVKQVLQAVEDAWMENPALTRDEATRIVTKFLKV